MSALLAVVASNLVFGLMVLLFIMAITCLISAVVVSKAHSAERRFEKRIEYSVFAAGSLVGFLVLLVAPY